MRRTPRPSPADEGPMFRFFARTIGLWLLAGSVVAAVVDGAKSIAAARIVLTSLGEAWVQVHRASLGLAQAAIERHVSPMLWTPSSPGFCSCRCRRSCSCSRACSSRSASRRATFSRGAESSVRRPSAPHWRWRWPMFFFRKSVTRRPRPRPCRGGRRRSRRPSATSSTARRSRARTRRALRSSISAWAASGARSASSGSSAPAST